MDPSMFQSQYSNVLDAFYDALNEWRCATLVNFSLTTVEDPYHDDGAVSIESFPMTNDKPANTSVFMNIECPEDLDVMKEYKWDISFNSNWANADDLKSLWLHEIGHAHLLSHVSDPKVMFTEGGSGLNVDDILGGKHISNLSSSDESYCYYDLDNSYIYSSMLQIDPNNCNVDIPNSIDRIYSVELRIQNPVKNKISLSNVVEFRFNKYNIFSTSGQMIKMGTIEENAELDLKSLPSAVYFLFLWNSEENIRYVSKIIKI